MKKLFGGLKITWKRLIVFAVICALYTAIVNQIPVLENTFFTDITISFEWWIMFAIIIIVNSKNNLDAALKTFVFFLISQPLIYLLEVPTLGIQVLKLYSRWVVWTILSFPAAYIGYYVKKDNWFSLLLLTPILFLLGDYYSTYLNITMYSFPKHMISIICCILFMYILVIFILNNKKHKIFGIIINTLIILFMSIAIIINRPIYKVVLTCNSKDNLNETYKVKLKDKKYGDVYIKEGLDNETYCIYAEFKKEGKTELYLENQNGEVKTYKVYIERGSYKFEEE